LLMLVAPILTYTADEIVEAAPEVLKGDAQSIFDLEYAPIDVPTSTFPESYMVKARERFSESIDNLKKTKQIKSTLELNITTTSETIAAMNAVEVEDWFVVSGIKVSDNSCKGNDREVGFFMIDEDEFSITLAEAKKCPRCWKFHAREADTPCARCAEVTGA